MVTTEVKKHCNCGLSDCVLNEIYGLSRDELMNRLICAEEELDWIKHKKAQKDK